MTFAPVNLLFGEATVIGGQPNVVDKIDCIYRPFAPGAFLLDDPFWGIYELNGNIINAAAYLRGPEMTLIGQSASVETDVSNIPQIDKDHIYFGPLIAHYGHFIVTSLARSWFILNNRSDKVKLLCHSDHSVEAHFGGYMGRMVNGLGLTSEHFTVPREPTRFKNLTIPGVAFLEQKYAFTAFVEPMHSIGDSVTHGDPIDESDKPIYLSKSNLQAGSVSSVINEGEVVELLREKGIEVCFPEQLSFRDQIRLFSSRRKIIGFAGSAFHNHIFSRRPPCMTCITLDPYINSNLILLDKLNCAEAKYYFPEGNISDVNAPGFLIGRAIINVPSFIDDLLEAAGVAKSASVPREKVKTMNIETAPAYNENCVPDHRGDEYTNILRRLHADLGSPTYLEIGTLTGGTLALSNSPSIAIDPAFQVSTQVIGRKEFCLFYQMESDLFFSRYDPKALLGRAIEFAFLDGMHQCEFLLRDFINCERHASPDGVIALHDCLPLDIPMTDRVQNGTPPALSHRGGWWTGDVWRTIAILKKHRPDLRLICLDAAPTGLVLVSNLDPTSSVLADMYEKIVAEMRDLDLKMLTVAKFLKSVGLRSTAGLLAPGALLELLGIHSNRNTK